MYSGRQQGITGCTGAVYKDEGVAQGMTRKTQGPTGKDEDISYGTNYCIYRLLSENFHAYLGKTIMTCTANAFQLDFLFLKGAHHTAIGKKKN